MALHGSLRTMPLGDLFMWVKTTSRSGVLTVTRDGNEWELALRNGDVVGYSGPETRDNLGHIVVTSGLLTEEDLRKAIQHKRKNSVSLQRALLDEGLLTPEQLQECLVELARESIYDLFIDLPGEFVYTEPQTSELGLDLDEEANERLPIDLNVNHLMMEGARRHDEWEHIRSRFPRDDIRVRVIHEKLPPIETLGVRQRRILASISAGQSISDICFELRAPIPSVIRTLAAMEEDGGVEIVDDDEAPTADDKARVEQLLTQSRLLREAGQFDEAIALLEVAVRMRPHDEEARSELREVLGEQIHNLYEALPPVRVPVVIADEARLRRLRLTPEERFLLDRLEAQMDIGSIIMVSSMSERETLKTLKKFLHSDLIALRS